MGRGVRVMGDETFCGMIAFLFLAYQASPIFAFLRERRPIGLLFYLAIEALLWWLFLKVGEDKIKGAIGLVILFFPFLALQDISCRKRLRRALEAYGGRWMDVPLRKCLLPLRIRMRERVKGWLEGELSSGEELIEVVRGRVGSLRRILVSEFLLVLLGPGLLGVSLRERISGEVILALTSERLLIILPEPWFWRRNVLISRPRGEIAQASLKERWGKISLWLSFKDGEELELFPHLHQKGAARGFVELLSEEAA
jgi:hypothetical protein